MAWTEPHRGKHRGCYYDPDGKTKKTKVFPSKRAALQAAGDEEARVRAGTWFDPVAGKVTLSSYVETQWLPNRGGELTTRDGYRSKWNQIKDELGHLQLRRILPSTVQGWVTRMVDAGVSPGTIRARVIFLQTVLAARKGTSAMRDGLIQTNPCWGVILPTIETRQVNVYEADETDAVLLKMDPYWRPLAMFAAETGLRWGELMGVTVGEFELDYRAVTVRRTVVEVATAATGNGTPFAWKGYPKGRTPRRVVLNPECRDLVRELVATRGLTRDDRLFSMPVKLLSKRRVQIALTPEALEAAGQFTAPNGRSYGHGTINGYTTGKCRCLPCKQASADYRYAKLPERIDTIAPVPRRTDAWPEGLPIGRTFFRDSVWLPAHVDAGVVPLRFHDLRASHISWLLAMGIDLPTVMERVGHQEFTTTRRYTKALSDADDKVLDAFSRRRKT